MFSAIKNFIHKIQNSSEAVKKLWLIIFGGLASLVVIMIWLNQIQSSLSPITSPVAVKKEEGIMAKTYSLIKNRTANAFNFFKDILGQPRVLTIEKKEQNFTPDNLEKIPATKLPNAK